MNINSNMGYIIGIENGREMERAFTDFTSSCVVESARQL